MVSGGDRLGPADPVDGVAEEEIQAERLGHHLRQLVEPLAHQRTQRAATRGRARSLRGVGKLVRPLVDDLHQVVRDGDAPARLPEAR